ncbi:hypothetical protein GGQ74_002286 [Desulfobaculum xiamenense]|uniref:Uncharacterized protein n=1 Tax=Desulfobaculum xiamenense TaxID=995050 RepID=A0A846QQI5_9BACT|nr:hypothetical protein [Desulfobaculum xiamenense]NJB68613.1 hypothetical protein [Desulfobaculum xiamenense]
MTVLYLSVLILLFLCAGPAYYSRMIRGYTDAIRTLEYGLQQLDDELEALKAERDVLMEREEELNSERIALVQAAHGLASFTESGGASSAVEYLMQSGKLRPEDLQKAKDFKAGSQSPYELEDVLVMLDLVSSYDMENAKRKASS